MKKNLVLLAAISIIGLKSFGQFAYGAHWATYPASFKLSTGFYSNNPQESFSLGYVNTVLPHNFMWWSNVNFWIQAPGGQLQGAYYVSDGPAGCAGPQSQVTNGSGMSAIESNLNNNYRFAITGAYDRACYFLTIDAFGNPVSSMQYPWPSPLVPSAPLVNPSIAEDSNGDYYLCGTYNSDMYIIKVNSVGTLIWSSFYSGNNFSPKDIIINPYNPGSLIIVGKKTDMISLDDNGFIMEVDGAAGGIIVSKEFGFPGIQEYFNTVISGSYINPLNPQGFVIGGLNKGNGSPAALSWVLKLDQNMSLLWSKRLVSTIDPIAGEIVDVIERQNTLNNFEYYALAKSNLGMHVYKLDDSGLPFPSLFNEYSYSIGGANIVPTSISYVNGPPANVNVGLHVFGTADNLAPSISRFYAHAYFNGEIPCTGTSSTFVDITSPIVNFNFMPIQTLGPNSCNNITISFMSGQTGLNIPCQGLLNSGNNQRMGNQITPADPFPAQVENSLSESFVVYTDPNKDKVIVEYKSNDNYPVKIDLYSVLGQHIKTLESKPQGSSGSFKLETDLGKLNLEHGVYIIDANINGTKYREKFIYQE